MIVEYYIIVWGKFQGKLRSFCVICVIFLLFAYPDARTVRQVEFLTAYFYGRAYSFALRCAGKGCPFFVTEQRKGKRKSAKGPNALWKPRARKVVSLSLHSFFREVLQLQLLRARLKESHAHGSSTQAKQQKLLRSTTHPGSINLLTKTILIPSPAARGGKATSNVWKTFTSFSSVSFEERQSQGGQGERPGAQCLRPRLRDVRV